MTSEWGGSNTPISDISESGFFDDSSFHSDLDKRVVIDWLSFVFDDLEYSESYDNYYKKTFYTLNQRSKINDFIMTNLFILFGQSDLQWEAYELIQGSVNSFCFSMYFGEHMRMNFAGPKSVRDRPTTQILFSGQACTEFVRHFKGDWIKLLDFLTKTHELYDGEYDFSFHGHFRRLDIAIDDFKGDIVNIYDLESYARKGHWVGSYQSLKVIDASIFRGGIYSEGYSLTFGKPGSSQLQIYDKLLERRFNKEDSYFTDVWYRYEMRFVNEKADTVVRELLASCKSLDQSKFGTFASQLLFSCIDFKVISIDSNKSQLKTLPIWKEFIGDVSKIDLKSLEPVELSIARKKEWEDRSLVTSYAQFFLSDPRIYDQEHRHKIAEGIIRLDKRQKIAINRYRVKQGLKPLNETEFHDFYEKYKRGDVKKK